MRSIVARRTIPRRMAVERFADARTVVDSAVALDEIEAAALEEDGEPAFILVPGDHDRRGAHPWNLRHPRLVVVAPTRDLPGCRARGRIRASSQQESSPCCST